MIFAYFILCSVLPFLVSGAEPGSPCTTPNSESAICRPIRECQLLVNALLTRNATQANFVVRSKCGTDSNGKPLVCCGTYIFERPLISTPTTTTRRTTTVIDNRGGPGNKNTIPEKLNPNSVLPDRDICGRQNPDDRLLGGTQTELDEFPWMALLRYRFKADKTDAGFLCAGTLINKRYILTAAHCLRTDKPEQLASVRLGEHNYNSDMDCITEYDYPECNDPIDVGVDAIIPHTFYSSRTKDNDIGLIRLAKNIDYTDYIRPICLPPLNLPVPEAGRKMIVSGWGVTENGTTSPVKLKVKLPIVNNKVCAEKLDDDELQIKANNVCAGGEAGKDACQGDSGGPLMDTYSDEIAGRLQWYQEGVVSRGHKCGLLTLPGIYTRVSRYLGWIQHNIKD